MFFNIIQKTAQGDTDVDEMAILLFKQKCLITITYLVFFMPKGLAFSLDCCFLFP
jgi:hypothetical protein